MPEKPLVAIVTGASRGAGRGIAIALGSHGCTVYLTGRSQKKGDHSLPGTIDHFLTERYSLYSASGKRIWRGDIYHSRWNLQPAAAQIETNSMIAAAGIGHVGNDPLLHFSEFIDVRIWWPVRVR